MLSYGCTRLEIGLQSIYEDVARDTNRGHTVAAVGECFRLAKDAGFKVTTFHSPVTPPQAPCQDKKYLTSSTLQHQAAICTVELRHGMHGGQQTSCRRAPDGILQVIAHMMPDLPNVGWERDVESFTEFFENPAFRTDGLKLYPTLVIRGTGLYELWKAGLYRNYDPSLLVELVTCLRWPLALHKHP